MRVVFMGTPEVAAIVLRALLGSDHEVAAVVTQPDKVRGRGRDVSFSPVKQVAIDGGLPVLQPKTPKEDGFAEALEVFEPNALAVVAYGHILPVVVLEIAPAMNVHFSLLPRYRGAAPVQRALMDGAKETGVSVFMLEPTVDTGPVVASERVAIGAEETAGDLLERLAPIGARLLLDSLDRLAAGTIEPVPQTDIEAGPAPKITADEAEIDWSRPAAQIVNLVRALNPRPGSFTYRGGKRLIVHRARNAPGTGPPGTVLSVSPAFLVAAGEGAVELLEVQLEGKKAMPGADFVRGNRPQPGERLGRG